MPAVRLPGTLVLLCVVALATASGPASAQAGNGGAGAPSASGPNGPNGGVQVGEAREAPARSKKAPAKRRKPPRKAKKRTPTPPPDPAAPGQETGHLFPVAGAYDFGGKDSRFGARREGHRHQGQDIAAAEGTPLVAPYAGTIEFVRYQRRGAGWYVVLDGDGEDRDYVFMHLRRGSIAVDPGDQVAAGQRIAEVGNTGSSSGPHLHFEIWVGGWYTGGEPIDALPLLRDWAGLS